MRDRYRFTDPRGVQRHMADTLLPVLPSATLGGIELLPHQRDAVARLRSILDAHHGALLADDVGLGKTFVALAIAHAYAHVHVIAPAGLRDMWHDAITRAGPVGTRVHSLHACSRTTPAPFAGDGRTLVIIDEAHHLRTARTARYRAIAQTISGCDLLLLSATPLHNRGRDLQTLFALFRGQRADTMTSAQRAALIVRRTSAPTTPAEHNRPRATPIAPRTRRPAVREHPPVRMPQDRETLSRLLALPAPLPAHDGAVAGALIRLGLLRAWCSSDAALTHAVRRRQLRGAALHDALRAGRHPTQQELRSWVVGDDDGQLAFPELLAQQTVESGPLLEVLQRHLDALGDLARHHARHAQADHVRADALRTLLDQHPDTPIVAFSQFTRTVAALQRALADIAGVGVITSRSGHIASGPLPRTDVLAHFAPLAHGRPPPPPHQRIRLLLATDLVAEGVNLQDAGVVVHLDLPWTHALRTQRVGRCARLGSPHRVVHVYRLAPARFAENALRLDARLAHKQALARALVGSARNTDRARSAAERATAWHERLRRWRHLAHDGLIIPPDACPIAAVHHHSAGALVLLHDGHVARLLAVRPCSEAGGDTWHVQPTLRAQLALMRAADHAARQQRTLHTAAADDAWRTVHHAVYRALRRWWRREQVRAMAGQAPDAVTNAQRTAMRTLHRVVRALSTADRRLTHGEIEAVRHRVQAGYGAGHDGALRRWCLDAPHPTTPTTVREWLAACPHRGASTCGASTYGATTFGPDTAPGGPSPSPSPSSPVRRSGARVTSVLLLVPD